MSRIAAVLLELNFARPLLMATLVVTVRSFFDYVYVGIRQIGNEDDA